MHLLLSLIGRLDTDIAWGRATGMATLLVMTGAGGGGAVIVVLVLPQKHCCSTCGDN